MQTALTIAAPVLVLLILAVALWVIHQTPALSREELARERSILQQQYAQKRRSHGKSKSVWEKLRDLTVQELQRTP